VINTNRGAPHYNIFSGFMSVSPSDTPLPYSAPYSPTPSDCFSLITSDQVLHPYKTTGRTEWSVWKLTTSVQFVPCRTVHQQQM